MSTGQEIFNGALAKSTKNEPTQFGPPEVVRRLNDRLRGLFLVGSTVNPGFYGVVSVEAETGGVWSRPTDSISVERIEQQSDGAEVVVVPLDDQQAEPSKLSVYEWNQTFNAVTNAAGTPAGNFDIFGPTGPATIAVLPTAIDLRYPELFDELLVLELAIDFSLKDGRVEEEGVALVPDRNAWLARYVQFLRTFTGNLRQRFGNRRNVNIEELIPLLAGGSRT